MARRSEEELRREAVRRRLAGESPERIAASLGRTRRGVSKWAGRHASGERDWERGRKPGRAVNRTDPVLEDQVIAVRRRLVENAWAQTGSDAIAWELEKLGIRPAHDAHDRAHPGPRRPRSAQAARAPEVEAAALSRPDRP